MSDEFGKLLRNLFTKPKAKAILPSEPHEPSIRQRPPNPDELVLGWAGGKDDSGESDVLQLKGVSQKYRDAHFYVVGATRSGKTKFLETIIKQDIENGFGFGMIDPAPNTRNSWRGYSPRKSYC